MHKTPEIELLDIRNRLLEFANAYDTNPAGTVLNTVWERANEVSKSASGSWLGYHANVYYRSFSTPPAGTHFDIEHGTSGTYYSASDPNWIEVTDEQVFDVLLNQDGKDALASAADLADQGLELFKSFKADVVSILSVYLDSHDDKYVSRMLEEIEKTKVLDAVDIANQLSPKRQLITSDMRAVQQGTWAPPHVKIQARISAVRQPAAHCKELANRLEKIAAHLSRVSKVEARSSRIGTNVFIGHGRSFVWRDLKDFIKDRLSLPYDEFNRIPVAGITNIARLSEMLDSAACAFVIMTAEDELADGKVQARMNVIHEVGLFQGRLGFTKAIVLLEEGCEEFSNIQGLGQIRFPKGNLAAKFEEIRLVLEREGVLEAPKAS